MKRAIHPIKADMMRVQRMFPAKFGLALMLAFGLLFGVFLKNGTTLLAFGNSVFGEDIGFLWNLIDPSAPDESLVRSAFAGTSLFVPLIVCLAILQERGYEEGCRISSARGLARFNGALAHVLSSSLIIGAAYSALCLLLFAIAITRGGQNYAHSMLAAFLPAMMINAVLVISIALETVTIYRITGSAVLSGAAIIIGFVMSLTLYGAFLQAPIPSLRWIFFLPGPYLGVGCALGYSDMGQLTLLGYGVAASCLSVLIYALLSFRAGVCSMARQIKRLLQSELKHVSKWAYALILVIYAYMVILQLNSFPMWFCSLRENSFLGFFPDPTLPLSAEDVLLFGNAEVFRGLLFNVAPLAHALFFPFIAACIVPRFVSSGFIEEPWGLSEARGGKRVCAIVARAMLSSFALLGAFILSSVVLYCLNCTIVLDAQQYFNLNIFCYRLLLASAVCLAYVVSCVIAVSYFGAGFGPIGMLLLVNVVAIYIQIGANSMLPLPASMLMWICGVTPLGNGQCISILIDCLINVASVVAICFTVDRLRSRFL